MRSKRCVMRRNNTTPRLQQTLQVDGLPSKNILSKFPRNDKRRKKLSRKPSKTAQQFRTCLRTRLEEGPLFTAEVKKKYTQLYGTKTKKSI